MNHIHFIGICGVAMSALAIAAHKKGWKITGSDAGFFPPVSTHLQKHSIAFYPGWHPEKMMENGTPDLVVVGAVASSNNLEFVYVQEHNIPFVSYPQFIADHIVAKHSIVCAGTYGKTTSAALLTWILTKAGYNPSYMFGGLSPNLDESARLHNDNKPSDWSVLEGDEYKTARWDNRPKFKLYSPTHLLLTSVVWDHADLYPTEDDYMNAFKDLVQMIPHNGLIVASTNNTRADLIANSDYTNALIIRYGTENADYTYGNIQQTPDGTMFTIRYHNKEQTITTPLIGEHMVENICGCFALAKEIGIAENLLVEAIKSFYGVKRRLEKRYSNGIAVYDDLAHSPAKAKATLKTLREVYAEGNIIAVYEPNTGNRTTASISAYANAFQDADEVLIPLLTKIKTDPNDPDPPFDGEKLAAVIGQTHPHVRYIANDDELLTYLTEKTQPGDAVVFLGSRSFRGMIEQLIKKLK